MESIKKRILIIEDNEILINTMQFILMKEGYELLLAKTGKEGLDLIEKNKIDLLITDLALPYANGIEIIDRLRKQNSVNFNIPIIIVSGYRDDNTIVEGFEVGANDYIKKPVSPSELISRVRLRIGKA